MSGAPAGAGAAAVVVYTRAGCHLCDTAVEAVAAVCAEQGVDWTTIDIDTEDDLVRRFGDQVPVTFVAGAQHDFWRVDPDRLRRALRR